MEVTESQKRRWWYAIRDAAEAGNEAKLDELVSQGVSLDVQLDSAPGPVLHLLASSGNTRGAELLISRGANIDEVSHGEIARTALHIAVLGEHADLVQRLIALSGNVHARIAMRSGQFSTALHLVAEHGSDSTTSVQILRHLLQHGEATTDLQMGDADGDTPLHCAALNRTIPHVIIRELLRVWSTSSSEPTSYIVSLRNHRGPTSLHYAVALDNQLESVKLLLNAGASKDACDNYGATPFHYAARSGNKIAELVRLLDVEDVDAPASKNGFTALHYAAWNKRHEAVGVLLGHGASVNVIDTYKGDTPLHLAARRGDAQVIEMLIKQGNADVLLLNKEGELALGLADDRGHHEAAKAFMKAIREQNRQYSPKDLQWTKHSCNGASLLHYFAAYGAEEDMAWFLKVISIRSVLSLEYRQIYATIKEGGAVNMRDNANRNAVHWAAMKGNKHALRILARNNADLNADKNEPQKGGFHGTPLYLALLHGKKGFADELMKMKSECKTLDAQDWLLESTTGRWMRAYYEGDAKLQIKLDCLRDGFKKNKYARSVPNEAELFEEIPLVFLALYAERADIAMFFQQHSEGEEYDAVNEKGKQSGRTSLHWATLLGQRKIVAQLCRKLFKDDLIPNEEDKCGKTAVQYAKEMGEKEIEKELMQRSDVRAHIEGLYKDRQVHVDAANAILVGAALIAGVTFAGWLQPPLGYASYYNLPKLSAAPPGVDAFQTYASIQQHAGVRIFWVLNGLSFSFAIASVLASLVAVVPIPRVYIGTSVAHLRRCLPVAAVLLGSSIAFVLGAFAAAGFAVLPPLFNYQALMMGTTIVGAMPCVLLFIWFWRRLAGLMCPESWVVVRARAPWRQLYCFRGEAEGRNGPRTPTEIVVVESSTTIEESTDGELESIGSLAGEEKIGSQDYEFGADYEFFPWQDGLNVPPASDVEQG